MNGKHVVVAKDIVAQIYRSPNAHFQSLKEGRVEFTCAESPKQPLIGYNAAGVRILAAAVKRYICGPDYIEWLKNKLPKEMEELDEASA